MGGPQEYVDTTEMNRSFLTYVVLVGNIRYNLSRFHKTYVYGWRDVWMGLDSGEREGSLVNETYMYKDKTIQPS